MISDTLGAWLFTQTWQVAVLVLVVTAVAARWGRTRPHLAHALWLVVLLKCFTPPIWASPSGLFCWLRPAESPNAITAGEEPNENWSIDNSDRSLVGQGVNSDSGLVGTIVAANSWESNATRAGASASGASWTSVIREFVMRSAVGVWLVGALLALTLGAVRAGRFIAQLKRSSSKENAELTAAVEQLRRRLGVRRAVRVRVTRASVGPVIVGLLRPTIYLPAALVEGWNAATLEPILAHELVHQRRGDLWFCWLQWVARGLWWFHPAVAWACRCWNREVERCCDEETVAGMDYPPGRYARSLLSVLERKLELRAAPVFPGVRPLDVTTYRLERIMRLGHGSRRRAPLWSWGLMFAAALAALPGAAFVAEAKDRRRVRRPSAPPTQIAPAAGSTEQQEAMFRMALKERYEFQEPDANAKSLLIAVEILTCDSRTWDRITDGQLANERASVWDRTRLSRIMTQLEADRHTNRLYAPRVVVFEGKTAQVQSVNQRPFVVGFEDSASVPGDKDRDAKAKPRPIVKIFEEGVRIELCGRRESDELIELQFKATHGSVAGVTTSRDAAGREIQIPQLNESRVDTSVRLTEKQAFVCAGGVQQRADGASERIVYIVRCESVKPTPRDSNDSKATPARAAVEPTSGLTSPRDLGALRVYAVADLVVPIPRTAELDMRTNVAESPRSRTTPAVPALPKAADFEPLVKLIKSTVNPSGWQPEGSCEIQTQVDRMALVVRADAQTHEMVADLLTQLRRLQDVQVAYETVLLSPNEKLLRTAKEERWSWNEANRVDAGPPIAALDEAGATRLREQIASGEINVLQTPKITVFNGQGMRFKLQSDPAALRPASSQTPNRSPAAAVSDRSVDAASVKALALEPKTPHDLTVRFATVVSSDRRNLRLTVAVGEQSQADELLGGVAIREIKDAQTIVVDLSGEQMSTEWKEWKERGPLAQSPEGQAVLRSLVARQARQPLWLVLRPRVLILVDEALTPVRADVISPSGDLEFAPAARP